MGNSISFRLHGRNALFTDPITRVGGEKCSYHLPTYEAIKGVLKSIYWKPTIIWHVDRVRVVKSMRTQTKGTKPIKYHKAVNDLATYTFMHNVEYQIEAHYEWNYHRPELADDRNDKKHNSILKRALKKGGRQDIFLGTRDCQGYVEPCVFGEGEGAYDNIEELGFGLMFHGFDYPDETGKKDLHSRFWHPVLKKGILEFPRPENCTINRYVRPMSVKDFIVDENLLSIEKEIV